MKKLFTLFAAAMASLSMMAIDWQGTTPATDGATQYYVYNVKQGKWLVDQQTYPNNAYVGQALADSPVAYVLSGSSLASVQLIAAESRFPFAIFDKNWNPRVSTGAAKSGDDIVMSMDYSVGDNAYTIYRAKKFTVFSRNVYSSSATRVEIQKDASAEWRFVSMQEYADSMRTYAVLDTLTAYVNEPTIVFDEEMTFTVLGDTTVYDTIQNVMGFDSVLIQPVHVIERSAPTALPTNKEAVKAEKILRNGQLYIRREDVLFDLRGQRVK